MLILERKKTRYPPVSKMYFSDGTMLISGENFAAGFCICEAFLWSICTGHTEEGLSEALQQLAIEGPLWLADWELMTEKFNQGDDHGEPQPTG